MITLEINGNNYFIVFDPETDQRQEKVVTEDGQEVGTWYVEKSETYAENAYTAIGILLHYDPTSEDPVPAVISVQDKADIHLWDVSLPLIKDNSTLYQC